MGAAKQVRLYLYGSWCAPHSYQRSKAGPFVVRKASNADIMGPDRLRTFEGVEPMGRGRAKAKQVKVARQLKYNSGGTDLDRLRAELGVGADQHDQAYDRVSADRDEEDDEAEDDEEDDDEWSAS
jgi:Protein of unknown function (DUF3073)